ncbi:hypothetical protein [Streptomyces sp. NPDC058612]|uniref:hypothetical protein n=1 Tax=Streptomyces sp. NPDC058612 TaxID=3346555 RepID=UPI00364CFA6C
MTATTAEALDLYDLLDSADEDEEPVPARRWAPPPVIPAETAAHALATAGHHVHLVSESTTRCLTHGCTANPAA